MWEQDGITVKTFNTTKFTGAEIFVNPILKRDNAGSSTFTKEGIWNFCKILTLPELESGQ